MTEGSNRREVVEWARHRGVICLGILTISTAVTGVDVAATANSPIPGELGEGNLNAFNLVWAVAGGLAAGIYLATILVTGVTINMIPGSRIRDLDLKQIGLLLTHVLFAFEAILLTVMLVTSVLAAPGPPPAKTDVDYRPPETLEPTQLPTQGEALTPEP